ncbi:MAG: DUF2490 domain-containing protein, partial [Cytophagaceae bacterium]
RYHNKITLSDKWEWQTHLDERRFMNPNVRHHTLIRTQPFYHLSDKIALSQGFVYSLQHAHDPLSKSELIVPELRPFQEVLVKNDLGRVQIRHRYRLEERFFQNHDGFKIAEGHNFNWRARYQFQAQRRMFRIDDTRNVYFRIAEEIMLNFGESIEYNIFDQNRFSAAFYINLNQNFDLEAGYSHWYQQLRDGKTFFNRHIYRITLFHNIDWRR